MDGIVVTESFRGRELFIYLPPSYETSRANFPVVYVQDGGDLFDPRQNHSLARLERMFALGELGELLLIGIKPKNRLDEYTPWPAKALSDKFGDFGGLGFRYLSFLVEDLKPYIDSEFKTDSRRQQTGMIGASLGGLISMYAAYLYPDVFGKIGSISGSFWYEGFIDFMQAKTVATGLKIYMDVGRIEGIGKRTIQKDMVSKTKEAYTILKNNGLTKETLRFVIEEGAPHDLKIFSRRFPESVKWLYTNETEG
ncbi:alpha/beta hydrolase [Caenibacillus caldisaponilyticus]|uniref:alpha/beta hydrolase n=1 Tax=Caenibacillus caldisaponilyticus TaxID=1674942 RepID=UPI00098874FA|nr:alpha/beta hydrolase-fold protein [Caenibacillus caldisaponilyticus]